MTLPHPFLSGHRLVSGGELDVSAATPIWSYSPPITATSAGIRVYDSVVNVAEATVGGKILLPTAVPGKLMLVYNNTAVDIKIGRAHV